MPKLFHQLSATLTLALLLAGPAIVCAQDPAKPSDDALDSLLEKLSESPADKSAKAKTDTVKPKSDKPKPKEKSAPKPDQNAKSKDTPKPKPTEKLPTKDQELDDLLEKLGETKDAPPPKTPTKARAPVKKANHPASRPRPTSPTTPSSVAAIKNSTSASRNSPAASARNKARSRNAPPPSTT